MKYARQYILMSLRLLALGAVIVIGLASILATLPHSDNPANSGDLSGTGTHVIVPNHVRTGSRVDLDARSTTISVPDDYIIYRWVMRGLPPGSHTELSDTKIVNPSFVADVDGEYEIELATVAISRQGYEADRLSYIITAHTDNAPPMAEAGAYQEVMIGETVHLNASLSSDADDDVLGYSWILGSPNSETLSELYIVNPTFVPTVRSNYILKLVVNDGVEESSVDSLFIEANLPQASHPVAMAGPDQYVVTGSTVQLDGSASYSPEPSLNAYTALDYEWRIQHRPRQSEAVLSNINAVTPTFIADLEGAYVISLRVYDDGRRSRGHIDEIMNNKVVVFVGNGNTPPLADGGVDHVVNEGVEVTLDGSNSSDAENAQLSYAWTMIKAPIGSTHVLLSGTADTISFIPDLNGTYLVRLVVNDGQDESAPDIVRVVAAIPDIGVNLSPTANAGPDQPNAITGTLVTLNGSGSSDPEGLPLSYAWSLVDWPAGSTAALSGPTLVNPTFTPDEAGAYVARLAVNDGNMASVPDEVTITASEPGAYTELTLTDTTLPYTPSLTEVATLMMIDLSIVDTLVLGSGNVNAVYVALYVALDGTGTAADFFVNPSWTLISSTHSNPVSDAVTPSFIVQRIADSQYYKITLDFTPQAGTANIQVDTIQAWNCGASAANCPP
jgi:hypothetical protein